MRHIRLVGREDMDRLVRALTYAFDRTNNAELFSSGWLFWYDKVKAIQCSVELYHKTYGVH